MYRKLLALALLLTISGSAFAATNTFTGTGNFSDGARWSDGVPTADDDLVISGTCSVDNSMNDTLSYQNLSFGSGTAVLNWTQSAKILKVLAITGSVAGASLDMTGGGTLELRGSGSPFSLANLTFTSGTGKVEFAADNAAQTVPAATYYDLKISGNRQSNAITFASGTISIKNVLDITAVTFDMFFPGFTPAVGSVVDYIGTGAQTVVAIPYHSLVVSGSRGGATVTFEMDPAPGSPFAKEIVIGASFTLTATAVVYTTDGSTIVYGGTAPQSVANAGGFKYGNLKLANPTNITFSATVYSIAGDFMAAPNPSTYTVAGSTITFVPPSGFSQFIDAFQFDNLSITGDRSGGSVQFNAFAYGISGNFVITASNVMYSLPPGSSFNYNGTGAQNIAGLPYVGLSISDSTPRSITFDPMIGIAGVFSPGATNTYDASTTSFAFAGTGGQVIPPLPGEPYFDLAVVGDCQISSSVTTTTLAIPGTLDVAVGVVLTTNSDTTISGGLTLLGASSALQTGTLQLMGTATVVVNSGSQISTGDIAANLGSSLQLDGDLLLTGASASTLAGSVTGAGGIFKNGAGDLSVSAPNATYTGELTISTGGQVTLSVADALGTSPTAGDINANSGTLVINNFALANLVQAAGGTVRGQGTASSCKVSVAMSSFVDLETVNATDVLSAVLMSSSGPGSAFFNGPGRLVLLDNPAPASYFDGGFNLTAGVAQLNSGTALGSPMTVAVVSPSTKLASNTSQPIIQGIVMVGGELGATGADDRVFAGPISISGASTFQLRDILNPAQARNFEIAGVVNGPGPLTISGPPSTTPKLKLTGLLLTQTGVGPSAEVEVAPIGSIVGTQINVGTGGILTTTTNGNVAVLVNLATGAILRGTGGFQDMSSVVSVGGVLEPGPLAGTGLLELTAGMGSPSDLSMDTNTVANFDLSTPASSDRIDVSGTLVLDGSLNVRPTSSFAPGIYTLFTHGGLTNNVLNLPPAPPGLTLAIDTTTASSEVRLVVGALPLAFANPNAATVELGNSLTFPIAVTGPTVPVVTVTNTALPPGIRRNGLQLEGTPTVAGTYPVTLTATNGFTTASQTLTITVNQPVVSSTFGPFAAQGKVGTAFFFDLQDQVAQTLTSVSIDGSLPSGLTLAGTTIVGTPKVAGTTNVNATLAFANGTGTGLLAIEVLAKTETLGPVLEDLLIDPSEPGINEVILMSVTASHPQNLPVTVTWDFGDGTAGSGELVSKTYTSGNTYTITVTATAGGKTTTLNKALVVSDIDPDAPVISEASASPTPSLEGQAVTFTAITSDKNGDAVTVAWDFGDGTSTSTANPATFTYNTAGTYSVSVVATDATGKVSRTTRFTHYVSQAVSMPTVSLSIVPASTAMVSQDVVILGLDDVQSFEGTGDEVDGGGGRNRRRGRVVRYRVTDNGITFSRADQEVDTDFGIPGRRAVKGSSPSAEFDKPMLAVAKSTSREKVSRKETGRARKTLPVSARDIGKTPPVDKEPDDTKMNGLKLKGDFFPSRSAGSGSQSREGAGSRATKTEVLSSDKVTATGSIMMPGGLDMSEGTEVQVALGNIVDKIVIDAKGRGKGKFTSLQMRIKIDKTTMKTVADVAAKFTIKMSVAEMVDNGFDTEGVVVSKEQAGAELNIQCAMMIGEVTYGINGPVTLKVSPKEDKASMVTRRVSAQ